MDWGIALGAAGVAIGLPALAMSVLPFAQMMWGRPKLKFEFVDFTGDDGKNLICSIQNEPVRNRFLKFIGVTRDTAELNAAINILEQGTNKTVVMQIPATLHDTVTGRLGLGVDCRPNFSVGFPIIHCTKDGPIVFDPRRGEKILIPPGLFVALILVVCGDRSHTLQKLMNIHSDPIRTNWL
jgi:hypothetical protein